MKYFNHQNKKGFILMVVFLIIFLLLLMAMYFFSFIITELKISKNQLVSEQCYYLAEAGVEEVIWKLKNDAEWKYNFENGENDDCIWSDQLNRNDVFFEGSNYLVTIENTDCANAEVTATGSYVLSSGITAQRIIKIKVFKALNPSPVEQIAVFTGDGDFYTALTSAQITDGGIFSNEDISVNWWSGVDTTETASVVGTISENWWSDLDAAGSAEWCSSGNWTACQGYDPIEMPMIDFDSDDANSYKNKADNIYTQNEFKDMLDNASDGACNCELHIYGITYVTGHVKVKRGTYLHVHGTLVADGSIDVGQGGQTPPFDARLYVYNTSGQPSGLLTKGSITTKEFVTAIEVEGLLYASDSIEITSLSFDFNIDGGIISREVKITSLPMNLTYDPMIIQTTLGLPLYSQVVTVEHWEEEY